VCAKYYDYVADEDIAEISAEKEQYEFDLFCCIIAGTINLKAQEAFIILLSIMLCVDEKHKHRGRLFLCF
jgi:hypothetical protein